MPGKLYLRMPPKSGMPAYWRLISDHEAGPAAGTVLQPRTITLMNPASRQVLAPLTTSLSLVDEIAGSTVVTEHGRLQAGAHKSDEGWPGYAPQPSDPQFYHWFSELDFTIDQTFLDQHAPGYTGGQLVFTFSSDFGLSHDAYPDESSIPGWDYSAMTSDLSGAFLATIPTEDGFQVSVPVSVPTSLTFRLSPGTVPDPTYAPVGFSNAQFEYTTALTGLDLVLDTGPPLTTGPLRLRKPDKTWVEHVAPGTPGAHPLRLSTWSGWETVLWLGQGVATGGNVWYDSILLLGGGGGTADQIPPYAFDIAQIGSTEFYEWSFWFTDTFVVPVEHEAQFLSEDPDPGRGPWARLGVYPEGTTPPADAFPYAHLAGYRWPLYPAGDKRVTRWPS